MSKLTRIYSSSHEVYISRQAEALLGDNLWIASYLPAALSYRGASRLPAIHLSYAHVAPYNYFAADDGDGNIIYQLKTVWPVATVPKLDLVMRQTGSCWMITTKGEPMPQTDLLREVLDQIASVREEADQRIAALNKLLEEVV